jgi:hypothetical protein
MLLNSVPVRPSDFRLYLIIALNVFVYIIITKLMTQLLTSSVCVARIVGLHGTARTVCTCTTAEQNTDEERRKTWKL